MTTRRAAEADRGTEADGSWRGRASWSARSIRSGPVSCPRLSRTFLPKRAIPISLSRGSSTSRSTGTASRCACRPMVILDDVHTLHPEQFQALFRTLARREIRFARWMMMRMDSLSPNAIFRSAGRGRIARTEARPRLHRHLHAKRRPYGRSSAIPQDGDGHGGPVPPPGRAAVREEVRTFPGSAEGGDPDADARTVRGTGSARRPRTAEASHLRRPSSQNRGDRRPVCEGRQVDRLRTGGRPRHGPRIDASICDPDVRPDRQPVSASRTPSPSRP